MKQTKKQFEMMYGNRSNWGKTTSAVFDVLFHDFHRPVAARKHCITTQSIHRFLQNNELKHIERIGMESTQQYLKAG